MCDNDVYGDFIEQSIGENKQHEDDPQERSLDELLDMEDMDTETFDPDDLW